MRSSLQGHFPEPEKDPVIQIASLVTVHGQGAPVVKNIMTLDTCAPIIGAEVMSFKTEGELLRRWRVRSVFLVSMYPAQVSELYHWRRGHVLQDGRGAAAALAGVFQIHQACLSCLSMRH